MRLAFSCGEGQSARIGKTGGNAPRISQSCPNVVTFTHYVLFVKDSPCAGGCNGVTTFLKHFLYNRTWSARDKAKAQADKHRTDPYVLVISSFPTEMWLGRGKVSTKPLKLAKIRIDWKGEFWEEKNVNFFISPEFWRRADFFPLYFFELWKGNSTQNCFVFFKAVGNLCVDDLPVSCYTVRRKGWAFKILIFFFFA